LAWILEDLARYDHPKFSFKGQLIVIISLVLLAGLILQIINWLPYQPWAYLGGTEDREAYLERNLGSHYLALQAINKQLPDDSVVTLLWEPRSYYCQVDGNPEAITVRLNAYQTVSSTVLDTSIFSMVTQKVSIKRWSTEVLAMSSYLRQALTSS
jgi:hypothetical protein